MTDKKRLVRGLELVRVWYIIICVAYFSLFHFIPVRIFCGPRLTGALYTAISAAGVLLLAIDLVSRRNWLALPHAWLLVLFFCTYTASILVNYKYNLSGNLKTMAWVGIQMLFLCAPDDEIPHETHVKHLTGIAELFVFVWFVGAFISIAQFCFSYGGELANVTDKGLRYSRQGFMENRLFGIFTDPNYAAVSSLIAVGLAILLFRLRRGRKWVRSYYVVSIVFQMIYVILSGSRTAVLGCAVALGVLSAVAAAGRITKTGIVRVVCSIMAAILSVSLFYGVQKVAKIGLAYVPAVFSQYYSGNGLSFDPEAVDLDREDTDGSDNISNNRFQIWGDYFTIVKSSPLLGASPRGALLYAQEHFPDMFVVERQYTVHNGYLDVLVGTGILGTVPLLIWLALAWWRVFRYLWKQRFHKGEKTQMVFILAVTLLLPMIAAFFLTELFFVKPVSTMLFWILFGYLLCFVRQSEGTLEQCADGRGRDFRRLVSWKIDMKSCDAEALR